MRLKLGSFRKISRPLYSAVGRTSKDTQRTSPRLRAAYWVATLLVPVRRQEMKTSASPAYCCVTACSSPARCRFSGQTQTASVTHDGQHRPSQQRENVTPRRPPQRPGAKQEQSGVTCLGREEPQAPARAWLLQTLLTPSPRGPPGPPPPPLSSPLSARQSYSERWAPYLAAATLAVSFCRLIGSGFSPY